MRQEKGNSLPKVGQVKVAFTNKSLTPYGGIATIIAKFLEASGFRRWIAQALPIEENSNNAKGVYPKVLAFLLTILCGGVRFSHLNLLHTGEEISRRTFNVSWLPKATSVITRFWEKIDSWKLSEMWRQNAVGFALNIVTNWKKIERDSLHFDSSVVVRYGNQQGAKKGYNYKKPGRPSHHPLIAFLGAGFVINLVNRSGDTHTSAEIIQFFAETTAEIGDSVKIERVVCDSGYYQINLIRHLEKGGYNYIISAPIYQILQRQILRLKAWRQVDEGIEVSEFSFSHIDKKWDRRRRYVVVRQDMQRRPKALGKQPSLFKDMQEQKSYRFSLFITNEAETPAEEVWRAYRRRAADENVIKELKYDYGIDKFNKHNFWATEAVMVMIALVFYNLMKFLFGSVIKTKKEKWTKRLSTLKRDLLIIPAILGKSGRQPVLRLSAGDLKKRARIEHLLHKIAALCFNCNAVDYNNRPLDAT